MDDYESLSPPSGVRIHHVVFIPKYRRKVVSTSASYMFTMPSASTTLTAHFK